MTIIFWPNVNQLPSVQSASCITRKLNNVYLALYIAVWNSILASTEERMKFDYSS